MTIKSVVKLSAALCLSLIMVGCGSDAPGVAAPTAPEKRFDYQIVDDVRSKIQKDSRLQGSNIVVTCDAGTVILSGTIVNREQFGLAQVAAASTKGARGVINRLQVPAPPQPTDQSLPHSTKTPKTVTAGKA
jgi:hypothetical protein